MARAKLLTPNRNVADPVRFGPLDERLGIRFTFAGTAVLNRFAEMLEPLDLTPGRGLALFFLHENPGCEQKALADALAVNEASAMSLVNRLEGLGFVERRPGRNKRSNALHLTGLGEERFRQTVEIELELSRRLFGWMEPAQRDRFMAMIDEVRRRAAGEAFPDSSAIEQASYDPARRVLDIRYAGGDRYSYFDVPPEVYEQLRAAPSVGAFVNRSIKPLYAAEIEPRRRRFRPR